jgi:hypothetical protein
LNGLIAIERDGDQAFCATAGVENAGNQKPMRIGVMGDGARGHAVGPPGARPR